MRIRNTPHGFSLIETAIVLLIAGLLVAGGYQLMSSMQQQRADQASANEMRTVVTALQRFLTEQQGVLTALPSLSSQGNSIRLNNTTSLTIGGISHPALTYFQRNYLPEANLPNGFDLTAAGYVIGIRRMNDVGGAGGNRPVLRGLVLRTLPIGVNEARTARVANLVGPQGGVVRDNGSGAPEISGVQGSWAANAALYALGGLPQIGQIAGYTTVMDSQINTNVVSRTGTGLAEANTMRADLVMGDLTGQSKTYAIRNAAGYGQTLTNAIENSNCGGVTQLTLLDENGIAFAPVKNVTVDRYMIVTGTDAAGRRALLQCIDNGSGTFQWRPVGGTAFDTSLNHRTFFENRDRDNFVFNGMSPRTGYVCTHVEGCPFPGQPSWASFIGAINNPFFTASRVTAPFGAYRATNKWYYNDTGRPMVLSVLCSDGVDWAYVYIRANYDTVNFTADRARLVAAIKSRDNDGAYSITAIIPVNAAFALGMRRDSNKTNIEYWSEYNAF